MTGGRIAIATTQSFRDHTARPHAILDQGQAIHEIL
jgi:hypothetical protein